MKLKRKIYDKLVDWKEKYSKKYAIEDFLIKESQNTVSNIYAFLNSDKISTLK